jgi:rare lipoprotein A (peptidoglycan hydrolase)
MKLWLFFIGSIGLMIGILLASYFWGIRLELVNKHGSNGSIASISTNVKKTTPSLYNDNRNVNKNVQKNVAGLVSYYSRKGCLGCSTDFTMANGKKLDDGKLTIAYNVGKLNRRVKIINLRLGNSTIATVTDRGGFEKHNKIADLSVATKIALGCNDVCRVQIEEL